MMRRFTGHRLFYATCLMLVILGALQAWQAGGDKLVKVGDIAQITDAVMITDIAVAGKSVDCGLFIKPPVVIQPASPFQAGSDWLQQTAISLLNRTNQTIVFGSIDLTFLDTGDCHTLPCVGYTIRLGQVPAVDNYSTRTGRQLRPDHPERSALNWEPDQKIVVHVSDHMAEIEHRLSNHLALTGITTVEVRRGSFYFEDGMKWDLGFYSVPVPEHPGKFRYLPDNYFPGRRGHNWPPGFDQ